MKTVLLLGAMCAGLTLTTVAEAQLLGAIRGSVMPASIQTMSTDMPGGNVDGPPPVIGVPEMPEPAPGPLRTLVRSGALGSALEGPLSMPLPGLDDVSANNFLNFGDDVIVRVGGVIGPAPTPVIPIPELGSTLPGILSIGENVIVRVGGVIGPAPTPVIPIPELGSTLPGILSVGENVIVRVGGVIGPAPTPVIPIPDLRPRNPA